MRTPKNLTIFHSTEPKVLGKEVATSGAYDDSIAGVVSKKALLPPGNYIIVPSTHLPETEGDWEVTVFYDKRDTQIF
jgi:calpain-7